MKNLLYKSIYSILLIVILLTFSCNKDDDMDEVTNTCPDCPVIDRIEPKYGQSGDMVTIHGSKFNALTDIYFNDTKATLIEDNNTDKLIEAVVPSLSGSNKSLIIAEKTFNAPNGNIQTLRSTDEILFTYITNNASLSSLSPASGLAGVEVTITGSNLNNVERVTFGDNDAEILNKSASEISVRAPSTTSLDVVDVIAYSGITVDGEVTEIPSNSLEFSYLEGPNITDFFPKEAKMGEEITVTGSNFGTNISDIEILTNGVQSNVVSVQDNQIIFEVPKSAGSGIISVLKKGISVETGEEFEYILTYTVNDFADLTFRPDGIEYFENKVVVSSEYFTFYYAVLRIRENNIETTERSLTDGRFFYGGEFDDQGVFYGASKDGQLLSMNFTSTIFTQSNIELFAPLDMIWDNEFIYAVSSNAIVGLDFVALGVYNDGVVVDEILMSESGDFGDGQIPRRGFATALFTYNDEIQDDQVYFTGVSSLRKYNKQSKAVETITGREDRDGYKDGSLEDARFEDTYGLASNEAGVFYVSSSHSIRKIDIPNNKVSTVSGNGTAGDINGDGPDARFNNPRQLCFDQDGNLLVADSDNNKIRKITIE